MRYTQRGVDVEIAESEDIVEVKLDGHPIAVTLDRGEYHSQLANQFMGFPSLAALVDSLIANEGRTWTLHGNFCDDRCARAHHVHDAGGPVHGDAHDHGGGGE